jgi:hypothetical protein
VRLSEFTPSLDTRIRASTLSDLLVHSKVTVEEWMACLGAAARWEVPKLRELAITCLEDAGPAVRLAVARRYDETRWMKPAFEELCKRNEMLTAKEIAMLDAEVHSPCSISSSGVVLR